MAHAWRKIHDVHARTPTDITTEELRRIDKLYAIEEKICSGPAEKLLAVLYSPAGLTVWSRKRGCVTSSVISKTGR